MYRPGLDAFRGLIVILMFAVHSYRIQAPRSPSANISPGKFESVASSALLWLMQIEPFIAASFLFLVGYSLVLSRAAFLNRHGAPSEIASGAPSESASAKPASLERLWLYKALKRALGLYALSAGLFIAQFGVAWRDLIFSSGILSAIAWAIVVCALCLSSQRPLRACLSLALFSLLLDRYLTTQGLSVSGLNAGPGGNIPLLVASLYGVWFAKRPAPKLQLLASVCLLCLALWVALPNYLAATERPALGSFLLSQLTSQTTSEYPNYGGLPLAYWLEHGLSQPTDTLRVSFWNHTGFGILLLLPIISLITQLFLGAGQRLRGLNSAPRPWPVLGSLGQHALLAYINHLVCLGTLELFGFVPRSAADTWLVVASLVLLSLMLIRCLSFSTRSKAAKIST